MVKIMEKPLLKFHRFGVKTLFLETPRRTCIFPGATSTAWPGSLSLLGRRVGSIGSARGVHAAMAAAPWVTAQQVLRDATKIQVQRNVVSFSLLEGLRWRWEFMGILCGDEGKVLEWMGGDVS